MDRAQKIIQHFSCDRVANSVFTNGASDEHATMPQPTYPPDIKGIVMVVFGCQGDENLKVFVDNLLTSFSKSQRGPEIVERASHVDVVGIRTTLVFGYWRSFESFDAWNEISSFNHWFASDARLKESSGYFREVMYIDMENFETLGSELLEDHSLWSGAAKFATGVKPGESGYFGAMRKRLPTWEVDPYVAKDVLMKDEAKVTKGKRFRCKFPYNTCVIRSGQDLTRAVPEEVETYDTKLRPVLNEGMQYIIDNPVEVGAFVHRFHQDETLDGIPQAKNVGFGYFKDIKFLESWSEDHATHLKIFHRGLKMFAERKLTSLFLWHEVFILKLGSYADYVNCHDKTSLLRWFGDEVTE